MTDFDRFVAYKCRICYEDCINDHRESRTRYRECRSCHQIPELDPIPIDRRHPDLLWAFHLILIHRRSEPSPTQVDTSTPGMV